MLPDTVTSPSRPFQTASPTSLALSMNPSGIHVNGLLSPYFLPNNSDKYLKLSNLCTYMPSEENGNIGEYYTLNTKYWKRLDITKKSDARGRIHVNENNCGKDIRVFVSDVDQELETCKSYILLPHFIYTEIRKSRVKDQAGEPLKVQSSGDVWMGSGNKDKYVKVFVKEVKNHA